MRRFNILSLILLFLAISLSCTEGQPFDQRSADVKVFVAHLVDQNSYDSLKVSLRRKGAVSSPIFEVKGAKNTDVSLQSTSFVVPKGEAVLKVDYFLGGERVYSTDFCKPSDAQQASLNVNLIEETTIITPWVCDRMSEKKEYVEIAAIPGKRTRPSVKPDRPEGPVSSGSRIRIEGRKLLVDEKSYYIKGVCWNPVPKKGRYPDDVIFRKPDQNWNLIEQDIALLKEAGVNTVRTYLPIMSEKVLDRLWVNGMMVIVPFFGKASVEEVKKIVEAVKHHPAVLMYEIGNEWNYNKFYTDDSEAQALDHVRLLANAVKEIDPDRLVSSSYGGMPPQNVVDALDNIDLWGLNIYKGISFENEFTNWKNLSPKPAYMSEFGADAFNNNKGAPDLEAQAEATRKLLNEIRSNSSVVSEDGVMVGGTIFEFSDEWWKDTNPDQQDNGGIAPGIGPYPDAVFNEEWWGLVTIDREKRPAYEELKKAYLGY